MILLHHNQYDILNISEKAACSTDIFLRNGLVKYSNHGRERSYAQFLCQYGHRRIGPQEVSCIHSEWEPRIPKCEGTVDILAIKLLSIFYQCKCALQCNEKMSCLD